MYFCYLWFGITILTMLTKELDFFINTLLLGECQLNNSDAGTEHESYTVNHQLWNFIICPLRSKLPPSVKSHGWSFTFHVLNRITSLWETFQATKCKPCTPSVARSTDCHSNHMGTVKERLAAQWNCHLRYKPHVNICDQKTETSLHLWLRQRKKDFYSCIIRLTECCTIKNSPYESQKSLCQWKLQKIIVVWVFWPK